MLEPGTVVKVASHENAPRLDDPRGRIIAAEGPDYWITFDSFSALRIPATFVTAV